MDGTQGEDAVVEMNNFEVLFIIAEKEWKLALSKVI